MKVASCLISAALVGCAVVSAAVEFDLSLAASAAENKRKVVARPAKAKRGQPSPDAAASGTAPADATSGAGSAGAGAAGAAATPGQTLKGPDAMRLCMESWDKDTQMTRGEWRATCVRTLREFPELPN